MKIGDIVTVTGTTSLWFEKRGVITEIKSRGVASTPLLRVALWLDDPEEVYSAWLWAKNLEVL